MLQQMIIDADLCIKLGSSEKYAFLYELLPLIAENIYMHSHAYGEVLMPKSAYKQLHQLVDEKKVIVVNETELSLAERAAYDMTFSLLASVMINPTRPNKNRGEACSLAYAKVKQIPIFATDESNLQPIIDSQLNTGSEHDIHCLRIENIVQRAKNGEIAISRKQAKALWIIAGKSKDIFDTKIWPL